MEKTKECKDCEFYFYVAETGRGFGLCTNGKSPHPHNTVYPDRKSCLQFKEREQDRATRNKGFDRT